jgi:Flp pilus assembly protein TadB
MEQMHRGTIGHPYSALNLRLALALFGLSSMIVLLVVFLWIGYGGFALAAGVVGVTAAINVIVVQRRRAQRRREEPGVKHSLFE